MADHNKPTVASVYDNMISEIDGRLDDIAQGFDVGTPTNVPTSAIGWKSSLNKWQKYTGSTWVDLAATYNISISGNAATATTAGSATTAGNITGTAAVANGGTGMTTYTLGDIVFASATNVLGKLASVSTGNVLLSGGVGAAPAYGKVTLTGHVSGILPVANGGTGVSTLTGLLKGNGGAAMTAATAAEIVAAIGSTAVANATSSASCSGNAASVTNGLYKNVDQALDIGKYLTAIVNSNNGIATLPSVSTGFEAKGNGTGPAVMTFHRPGAHAAFFGLDTDNQWKIGGWSLGAVSYNLIHSGNIGTGLAFSGGVLNCTVSAPVTSVNGNTGAVTVPTGFTLGAPVTPTGVASVTFTGIPSTANCVIVTFNQVSSSSGSSGALRLTIGPSSGVEAAGYVNSTGDTAFQSVGVVSSGYVSTTKTSGQIILTRLSSSNSWAINADSLTTSNADAVLSADHYFGYKAISGALESIRLALSVGNFDNGTLNIMYQ